MASLTRPEIAAEPLVNAAGLAVQSGLPGPVLVTPLMVMTQDAVPAFIVMADTLIAEGAVSATVAAQPVPDTVAVAPTVRRRPLGRVSTNAKPDCAGLPVVLVTRKLSAVLPPTEIVEAAKLLVSDGCVRDAEPTVVCTVLVDAVCREAPTCCVLVAVFGIIVPAGGIAACTSVAPASKAPCSASMHNSLDERRLNARCRYGG